MKYGIIDIGTNTIRSVLYNEALSPVAERVWESTILRHTDNGRLTNEGISALCDSLKASLEFFAENNTDKILCFATSAMRDVCNFDEVNGAAKSKCGIEIELLSEKEEAMSDFYSLKLQLGEDISGAGADLGGGSCQVLTFENGRLVYYCSRKLGVKRLYNAFGELNREKESSVREFIKKSIADLPVREIKVLYVMGGTSKKISKAAAGLFGAKTVTAGILSDIIEEYYAATPDYKALAGSEIYKIPYGALVFQELCTYFGAQELAVMKGGVREGYAASRLAGA